MSFILVWGNKGTISLCFAADAALAPSLLGPTEEASLSWYLVGEP